MEDKAKTDKGITLRLLKERFAVCRIRKTEQADLTVPFTFLSVTEEEVSLVCPEDSAPVETLAREDGWRCLKIEGILDFSMIGVIAGISQTLAQAGISLFAISTYNTDYVLIREAMLEKAINALSGDGYALIL